MKIFKITMVLLIGVFFFSDISIDGVGFLFCMGILGLFLGALIGRILKLAVFASDNSRRLSDSVKRRFSEPAPSRERGTEWEKHYYRDF